MRVDHGNVVVVVFVRRMRTAAAVSFADEENARQGGAVTLSFAVSYRKRNKLSHRRRRTVQK